MLITQGFDLSINDIIYVIDVVTLCKQTEDIPKLGTKSCGFWDKTGTVRFSQFDYRVAQGIDVLYL